MKGIHFLYLFLIIVLNVVGVTLIHHFSQPEPEPYTHTYIKSNTPSEGYTSVFLKGAIKPAVYKNQETIEYKFTLGSVEIVDANDSNFSGLYSTEDFK